MKKLCVIGEALIDFIPDTKGQRLKDVSAFKKAAGGAPANVAASVCKLGGQAKMITQLGKDAFGDFLIETMQSCGIDTSDIQQTDMGDTALAFVSLAEDGNRDFKFYRRTSADLMLHEDAIKEEMLEGCGILHFCSVDLVESPMKQAHRKLIEMAINRNLIISFDPNLRLSLWNDDEALKQTVHEFLPYAHIVKLADEELEFITGYKNIEEALPSLFIGNVQYIIYTMGKDGAALFHRDGQMQKVSGIFVEVQDTTGAGDSFIGAFLYQCLRDDIQLRQIDSKIGKEYLAFANLYAAYSTTKQGAISSMATIEELKEFKRTHSQEETRE